MPSSIRQPPRLKFAVFRKSLRTRIIAILALALLPALVLAIVQSVRTFNTAMTLADRTLVTQTALAAEKEQAAIIEARRTVETVARLPSIDEINAAMCREAVASIFEAAEFYDRITIAQANGEVVCSVPSLPAGAVLEQDLVLADLAANPDISVTGQFVDPQSGNLVVAVLAPILDSRGVFSGQVVATLRAAWFESLLATQMGGSVGLLALVNNDGAVIAATGAGVDAKGFTVPPAGLVRSQLGGDFTLFTARNAAGSARRIAAVPFVDDDVYLLVGVAENARRSGFLAGLAVAAMAPLAMYALALSVAWYALDRLVLRHIGRLREVVERIESGEESVRASEGAGAPAEIEVLIRHLNSMLDALDERERDLAVALSKQTALSKEIYHRVKNNLQIVSSLMNLQLRSTDLEPSKQALLSAQKRIQAMSAVHERLYSDENLSSIRLDTLLRDLTRTIQSGFDERTARTPTEVEAVPVSSDPDRAIPLSLLYTEALTNAYENSCGPEEGGRVRVTLRHGEPGYLILTVANKRQPGSQAQKSSGLGVKLINVLSRQLRGSVELAEGDEYRVEFIFPIAAPAADS